VNNRFSHFVAIDWSGAKGVRQNGIAVALCQPGMVAPALVRPGHCWSRQEVLEWLLGELPTDSLVGFDLSPGLPFGDCGAFFPEWDETPSTAKSLWQLIDELAQADPHLAVTSAIRHSELRRHFRHGKGDCGDLFVPGAGRMRLTELRQKAHQLTPSSCFNLVGAAQVGKSSLTGMRLLHRLGGAIPVWPFDPLSNSGSVVVEIYTSLAARAAGLPPGRSKMLSGDALDTALGQLGIAGHGRLDHYTDHATDAILTSAWLRKVAGDTELWNPPGLEQVAKTEGWTFGVR
jgi:hypothetical protein